MGDGTGRRVWERQQGEPARWFGRFDTFYRPLGPERSLLAAYNAWRKRAKKSETKSIAKSWETNAREWKWQERAAAWDDHIAARERAEQEAEELERRRRARETRRAHLDALDSKLQSALEGFNPEGTSLAQITSAVKTLLRELRAEYEEPPVHRHKVESKGRVTHTHGGHVTHELTGLEEIPDDELDRLIINLALAEVADGGGVDETQDDEAGDDGPADLDD